MFKGQGNTLENEYSLEVPIAGRDPLHVRVIKTSRIFQTAEGEVPIMDFMRIGLLGKLEKFVALCSYVLGWDRVINSEANRWAYIAVSGTREAEDNLKSILSVLFNRFILKF